MALVNIIHPYSFYFLNSSEGVENESVEQICFADKVLLNKIDLADEPKLKEIEREIRKLNPTTPILRCHHCKTRATNNVDGL
jgi:G3E family GTPase